MVKGGTKGQEEGKERGKKWRRKPCMTISAYAPYKLRSNSKWQFPFKQGNKRKKRFRESGRTIWIKFQMYVPSSYFSNISLKLNGMRHLWLFFPKLSSFLNDRSKIVAKVWAPSTGDPEKWVFVLFSSFHKQLFHFWVCITL